MQKTFKLPLLLSALLVSTNPTWANWCTVTHFKFNTEYTKMDEEGAPFRIGTLDRSGHTMALVIDGKTYEYKYLRNLTVDGLVFREFRNVSMIFQLSMPGKDGVMFYSRFMKDLSGTERGFSGICSGE